MTRPFQVFTAADFRVVDDCYDFFPFEAQKIADQANAILNERGKRVYGMGVHITEHVVSQEVMSWCDKPFVCERQDTHEALLLAERPITKGDGMAEKMYRLQEAISRLEKDRALLKKEAENFKGAADTLREQTEALRGENEKLKNESTNLREHIDEINHLRAELAAAKAERDSLKELFRDVVELRAKLAEAVGHMENLLDVLGKSHVYSGVQFGKTTVAKAWNDCRNFLTRHGQKEG